MRAKFKGFLFIANQNEISTKLLICILHGVAGRGYQSHCSFYRVVKQFSQYDNVHTKRVTRLKTVADGNNKVRVLATIVRNFSWLQSINLMNFKQSYAPRVQNALKSRTS